MHGCLRRRDDGQQPGTGSGMSGSMTLGLKSSIEIFRSWRIAVGVTKNFCAASRPLLELVYSVRPARKAQSGRLQAACIRFRRVRSACCKIPVDCRDVADSRHCPRQSVIFHSSPSQLPLFKH
jgi:hypothetical protein